MKTPPVKFRFFWGVCVWILVFLVTPAISSNGGIHSNGELNWLAYGLMAFTAPLVILTFFCRELFWTERLNRAVLIGVSLGYFVFNWLIGTLP